MAQKLNQMEKMFQGSNVSNAIEPAHKVKTENWPLESVGCRSLVTLTREVLVRW